MAKSLVAAALLGSLTACGGGPASPGGPAPSSASGTLELRIPAKTLVAGRNGRRFLSPSTSSVSISVTGIAQPIIADVSSSSSACTTAGNTRTCTIGLEAPAGTDTFSATLYPGPSATGSILGQGSVVQPIVSGKPFTLTIAISGTSAALVISAAQTQFTAGVPATTAVTVDAFDAGGNPITGNYTYPVTLIDSDTTGTFTLSPATVTNSSTPVTLAYSGGTAASEATISATETGVAPASVAAQSVAAEPGTAATPAPTASPVTNSNIVLTPAYTTFSSTGATSSSIAINGPASTNYAAMTATSSDTSVATATLAAGNHSLTVTSVGVGSATITVVPSDNSAGPGYESVYVEQTVIAPQARGGRK